MCFNVTYRLGRERIQSFTYSTLTNQALTFFINFLIKAGIAGTSALLSPAIITGCSPSVFPDCSTSPFLSSFQLDKHNISTGTGYGNILDILVFNEDRLQRLDTYQRIEDFKGDITFPASTGGSKRFFLCCNPQTDKYGWANIYSYSSLGQITCNLEMEHRGRLVSTGECCCTAGQSIKAVTLTPLVSEISIKSLRCDFSGTPYAGRKITDVKAYLTYVNAECSIVEMPRKVPARIINSGICNEYEVKGFQDRSMITQDITDELGLTPVHPSTSFLCYPDNINSNHSTRIVIEGKIGPDTYYWPIEINGKEGVKRNCRYSFDISIRRRGTSDPDILITSSDADIEIRVKSWLEKEDYQISF